jgi:starch-binding outer membrane protein, SusD/RagB family
MNRLLVPVLMCFLLGCSKEKTPAQPTNITVWDATLWSESNPRGLPIEGATVQLYATQQDYLLKKPAFTATTNKNGIASFTGAKEGSYFIVAFKDEKTNTWPDDFGRTKISDTLLQRFVSIDDPQQSMLKDVAPGDFIFRDLNADGKIDINDVSPAPYFKISINNNKPVAGTVIIGYPVNREGAVLKTIAQVKAAFAVLAQQIGLTHQGFVMLDGVLSDESDGKFTGLESDVAADWEKLDKFQIVSSNMVIRRFWNEHYTSIFTINKLMADIARIAPDETEVLSQLYAFRALVHVDLFRYFGEIPLVYGTFFPRDIYRYSQAEIRYYIYRDIMYSYANMPNAAPAASPWYATRAAINMTLARLYLEIGDREGVRSATNINDSPYWDLRLSEFSQVFVSPAGSEIIWAISPGLTSPFKEYFVKPGQTVNFFPVSRLTETHLIRATASLVAGFLGNIEEDLRIVAGRSGKTVSPINYKEDALREVEKLYREDFYREGFRYRFLHLTQQATKVLGARGYSTYHERMPIPDSIISKYHYIEQTPGYK